MNTTHTPGPWHVEASEHHATWICSGLKHIATVLQRDVNIDENARIQDANARLIASAPALLAEVSALKARCAELEAAMERLIARAESAAWTLYGYQTTCPESRLLAVALSDARAALAGKGDK